jgi:hypothetical protein
MARAVLVVLTKPVEGREADFDDWYSGIHLPEVVRLDGFVAARRFKHVPDPERDEAVPLPYLAIYEVEDGMLEQARRVLAETLARSKAAAREGREQELTQTDALHEERSVLWFEEIARVD